MSWCDIKYYNKPETMNQRASTAHFTRNPARAQAGTVSCKFEGFIIGAGHRAVSGRPFCRCSRVVDEITFALSQRKPSYNEKRSGSFIEAEGTQGFHAD